VARGIAYVLSSSLWRTSTFRLSTLFGAVYALGMALLLALIYYQTAGYLTQRVDNALKREAEILQQSSPETILRRFREEGARDPLNSFGLFSLTGERVAGDTPRIPQGLLLDGQPRDVAGDASATPRRAIGERTSWGEILVVERDTSQLVELRRIIINALLASGAVIASLGLMSAIALSIRPLRRVRAMQTATEAIISGDFAARLPVDGGQDELDQLARLVNDMVDEIERLLVQARTVGESVAHELRTPLTRLRTMLDHASQSLDDDPPRRSLLEQCVTEVDTLLVRFRALLRIAAVEARSRQVGIESVSLSSIVDQVAELYLPLAAERHVSLAVMSEPDIHVRADGELLFEALSNLTDNALKFAPAGGRVELTLTHGSQGPILEVTDDGPGIPISERALVTKRFFRGRWGDKVSGHGLGLSLVAAVADLHRFDLSFHDAAPGAIVRLVCRDRLTA
jgi:signal transduction histidine kinase